MNITATKDYEAYKAVFIGSNIHKFIKSATSSNRMMNIVNNVIRIRVAFSFFDRPLDKGLN